MTTKKDKTLAALLDIKRAILQGRDNAVTAISLMIKRVEDGGDLEPNPVVERAPRQGMKPMAVRTAPAPTPVPKKEPEPEGAEAADDGVDTEPQEEGVTDPKPETT